MENLCQHLYGQKTRYDRFLVLPVYVALIKTQNFLSLPLSIHQCSYNQTSNILNAQNVLQNPQTKFY